MRDVCEVAGMEDPGPTGQTVGLPGEVIVAGGDDLAAKVNIDCSSVDGAFRCGENDCPHPCQ